MTSSSGVTMVVAGLDYWLQGNPADLDRQEFLISDEWRLSKELQVNEFYMPPDFRDQKDGERNNFLKVPAFRFPLWSFCPRCFRMYEQTEFERINRKCNACVESASSSSRRPITTVQVAFIALCPDGHLQDFPFRDWVHARADARCGGELKLSLSGATLAAQSISCSCGKRRSFDNILGGDRNDASLSHLSQWLTPDGPYLCEGRRPWLAESQPLGCGQQLYGGVTGSVSNYYAHVRSAIYLPQNVDGLSRELVDFFERNEVQQFLTVARALGVEGMIDLMRGNGLERAVAPLLHEMSLKDALSTYLKGDGGGPKANSEAEQDLKSSEYAFLTSNQGIDSANLATRPIDASKYARHSLSHLVDKIVAIDKLRETRALVGFDRLKPKPHRPLSELKALMRRGGNLHEWLPAYEVYGEGIFFSLNDEVLEAWARQPQVQERVAPIASNPRLRLDEDDIEDLSYIPRLFAAHTFAHLMINQMVFSSGYAAASLRERIYVTPSEEGRPGGNGILIYTASGDVEGSLGGLVRLSSPGRLEVLIDAALEAARFCSSDPVCMEVGAHGQGPDSMNLAACHSCALVPETSCEMFNVYLDRGLVIGTLDRPELGFVDSVFRS
jgi:hypothetical protein